MSEILENALDSLRMAVGHYRDQELETADKWAILEMFHATELLLKERLYREHRLFIYKNIDQKIEDDSLTVGLREILSRFGNLGVDIPAQYQRILQDLQKRRNRIEHHRFVPAESHQHVLGEALKFCSYFLEEHLEEDLESHLPAALFEEVKNLVLSYEDLVRRAEIDAEAVLRRYDPKDQSMIDVAVCPECGNRTLVVGADEDYDKCYYCDEQVEVRACPECGTYVAPDELAGTGICDNCFGYKIEHD